MMKQPIFILNFNEAVLIPKNNSKAIKAFRIGVWIVVACIIIFSFIFKDNIFAELTWTSRVLLIVLAIGTLFIGRKNVDVPSPAQLQFYDDCLILYRPKIYYSSRVSRMEFNKMMYSEISKCVYKTDSKRIHIYGNVIATWYNYDKSGGKSDVPTYNRIVQDTLCWFSTRCSEDVDFVGIIKKYAPINVIVENS